MRFAFALSLVVYVSTLSAAQTQAVNDPNSGASDGRVVLTGHARELLDLSQTLGDWGKHYRYLMDSVERVYDRNEWNSEADLFSVEVIRAVQSKPPWAFEERLDTFMQIVGDRYLLDEGQIATLESIIIREGISAFTEHAPRIMQYAPEMIRARAEGQPITPEQVAKWSQLAEPVFQDVRNRFNRASREFIDELEPEQRELLKADIEATNHRLTDVYRMSKEWQKGGWSAEDWGLEDDPIQNGVEQGTAPITLPTPGVAIGGAAGPPGLPASGGAGDGRGAAPRPAGSPGLGSGDGAAGEAAPAPVEETPTATPPAVAARAQRPQMPADPWAKYVQSYIEKYALNEEQQQRAWLFYDDAIKRRDLLAKRSAAPAGSIGKVHERLFSALERRLDQLPTRAQRKGASDQPLPKPTGPAATRPARNADGKP